MRWPQSGAVFLIVVMSAATLGAQSGAEKDALEAQAQRFKALVAQNMAALEPMVADELTYCHASGQCDGKAAYLNIVKTGQTRWITMTPEGMKARIYGNAAVITGLIRQTVMAGGATQPLRVVIRSIEVYVRRNGRWQLANFQGTLLGESRSGPQD